MEETNEALTINEAIVIETSLPPNHEDAAVTDRKGFLEAVSDPPQLNSRGHSRVQSYFVQGAPARLFKEPHLSASVHDFRRTTSFGSKGAWGFRSVLGSATAAPPNCQMHGIDIAAA